MHTLDKCQTLTDITEIKTMQTLQSQINRSWEVETGQVTKNPPKKQLEEHPTKTIIEQSKFILFRLYTQQCIYT